MLPLIEEEVVHRKRWITEDQYADMLLLTQLVPGVIAVNSAFYVAKTLSINLNRSKFYTFISILFAIIGATLPSILIILLIASSLMMYRNNLVVEAAMRGIRPAVVALIFGAVLRMFKTVNKQKDLSVLSLLLPILCAIAITLLNINPVFIIMIVVVLIAITLKVKHS